MTLKPPFTSTPDMSAEEDGSWGVDVSYVETESDEAAAFDFEGTTRASDILIEDTPVTVRCASDAVLKLQDNTSTSSLNRQVFLLLIFFHPKI